MSGRKHIGFLAHKVEDCISGLGFSVRTLVMMTVVKGRGGEGTFDIVVPHFSEDRVALDVFDGLLSFYFY